LRRGIGILAALLFVLGGCGGKGTGQAIKRINKIVGVS